MKIKDKILSETSEQLKQRVRDNANKLVEPKQETLEEAMIKNGYHDKESDDLWREGAEFGAKWQQEIMYTEEEDNDLAF